MRVIDWRATWRPKKHVLAAALCAVVGMWGPAAPAKIRSENAKPDWSWLGGHGDAIPLALGTLFVAVTLIALIANRRLVPRAERTQAGIVRSTLWLAFAGVGWLNAGAATRVLPTAGEDTIRAARSSTATAWDLVSSNVSIAERALAIMLGTFLVAIIAITAFLSIVGPMLIGFWIGAGAWRRTKWSIEPPHPQIGSGQPPRPDERWVRRRLALCTVLAVTIVIAAIIRMQRTNW